MKKITCICFALLTFSVATFSQKKTKPKTETTAKQEIAFLTTKAQPEQITFSQENKTVFYYNYAEKKGQVKLLGKLYELNAFFADSKTKTYTLTGKNLKTDEPISILVPECKFRKSNGEDCFYASCIEASVSIPDYTVYLRDIFIQDCPSN